MNDSAIGRSLPASIRLFLAFVVVQAGFWLLFVPSFIHLKPAEAPRVEFSSFEYARLAEPSGEALQAAEFSPLPEQQPFRLASGYHATRASFSFDEIPVVGLAILPNDNADNREIYVNGNLLAGEGRMRLPGITFDGSRRQFFRAPAAMLRAGENRIETIGVVDVPFEGVMPPPIVGNYKQFEAAFGWPRFLFAEYQAATIGIGFVVSLFLLVALLRSQKRDFLFWFFALNTLWSLNALYRMWPSFPLLGYPRLFYDAMVLFGISVCWPMFVDAWTGKSIRWFCMVIYAAMAVGTAYFGYWYLYRLTPDAFSQASEFLNYSGIALMAVTFLRMIWHFFRYRDDRAWEAALLLSLGLLLALALYAQLTDHQGAAYIGRTQPLFLLTFAIAFFARNFRLFQSSAQITDLLQTQLIQRTADLETAHARETQLVRRQAHDDERQRIMRDMHDGLGSNLMSMLLAARRGEAKPENVAEELQSVVDEMRLMIDSMDSVGESLATALATFRERVQARVEGAGFAFRWSNEAAAALPDLGPRMALQIFRVMQEAVSNALKHSGGDEIRVKITPAGEAGEAIRISIGDNGKGMGGLTATGHGLDNMQSRAQAIGAQVTLDSSDAGVTVNLDLPARLTDPA